jgi:N-methylhydantoinase B
VEVTTACVLSTCLDRSVVPPFGLAGGDDGAPNLIWVRRLGDDDWQPVSSRLSNLPLAAGDVIRIETAIGGGFGDALEREPELVAEDVRDEYLTRDDAEAVYGVVLRDDWAVDREATMSLRTRLAADRSASTRSSHPRVPTFTPLAQS